MSSHLCRAQFKMLDSFARLLKIISLTVSALSAHNVDFRYHRAVEIAHCTFYVIFLPHTFKNGMIFRRYFRVTTSQGALLGLKRVLKGQPRSVILPML